jgi:hypothetical protein
MKMKNKWIITLALVALCGMAQASLVNYYITGATGDNWSGQFEVADLNVSASDNSGNTLSISANEWSPIYSDTPGYMFYFGSGGSYLEWVCYDTVPAEWVAYGLKFNSADLNTTLAANEWGTTWNELSGNTYAIDTGTSVVFDHPTQGSLTGTGGQISFAAIPEPATALTLALGGLLITGYRRMRKSYGHF